MDIDTVQPAVNPMRSVLRIRDFKLLWIGQATSMLGDQFHSIAAAWLVLQITGDPLALGTVLALAGIPRAIFTVLGGAITDRLSPRIVMLLSDAARLILAAFLAAQVFTGTLQVWMLYGYALFTGLLGGLFGPASMAIVPHIIPSEELQAGNSLTQGSTQLIGFIGPAVAGGMIAAFANENMGVGVAIAIDALTFVVSLATLWMMHSGGKALAATTKATASNVFVSIREGFTYLFKDPALRVMFIMIGLANFCFSGPVVVGVPYLADIRFPEGAAAYGFIIAGFAGGNLLGIILSGTLPRFSKKAMLWIFAVMFLAFGVGVAALAIIASTWLATGTMFVIGILNGFLSITLITGLQRNTPKEILGRLMSMILLANLAFNPLSQAATGGLLRWNVMVPFLIAGAILFLLGFVLMLPKVGAPVVEQLLDG